ncbi:hypothetical protein QBC43DRAFT_8441 [Cladorrhinum sp. PSN259]|nr:hypothetical protein QBC43DRAFT_8441 [Cladorrhinum sp. PSN259]
MASAEDIDGFVGITGSSTEAARRMLEMCGDLEQAITLWFSDEDLQRSMSNPAASTSAAATSRSASRPSRPNVGREDAQGVIHLDSDDDDVAMTENDDLTGFESDDGHDPASVARAAQEEEDAAMAKRLQEELYGGGGAGASGAGAGGLDDEVRAPISRTTETLVAGYGGDDDAEDEGHAAFLAHMRRRAQAQSRARNNPFARSIWDDPSQPGAPESGDSASARQARLVDLFKPPFDLMQRIPLDEAREDGKEEQKWVMVNLQDMSVFSCQALNRDIWKDEAIKALIRESFIFLQYDKTDPLAEQYINFYFVGRTHENQDNYPHVSIIDPRTGEQVKVWSGDPFPNARDFHAQLAEFLDRYSLAANSKNPVLQAKKEKVVDVDRMTEEEMLEMALQNSLETTNGGSSRSNVIDPDQLTKVDASASDKGKEREATPAPEPEPVVPAKAETGFTRIPSDRPHTEPANGPGTTRIQFRHKEGRTIRRFQLDETVSRIYEWLKAEPPVAGKSGVEFELKSMPQRQDLLELLDKTIQEAGLGNATIFLEYLED